MKGSPKGWNVYDLTGSFIRMVVSDHTNNRDVSPMSNAVYSIRNADDKHGGVVSRILMLY